MTAGIQVRSGRLLVIFSIASRLTVVLLLCALALLTEYINLKMAYNHPRLVELSSGKMMRLFYESADAVFSKFGDPMEWAQTNGGMTWSIRVMGVPFTDPVAALSVLAKDHELKLGFALGLIAPVTLALLFGRVFCSYICPASLLFFSIARIRRLLSGWFYFPDFALNRGFAWGILAGGLAAAIWTGHGIWTLILPYFAIGQTIFHGLAMGTLSMALGSVLLFAALDFFFGRQFTCRYVCPTGRLLGFLGRNSIFKIRRDAERCVSQCHSCGEVCPMKVNPKLDQSVDCSMCGECLVICPTQCLSIRTGPSPLATTQNLPEASAGRDEIHSTRKTWRRLGGFTVRLFIILATSVFVSAHHFKGLPHYNYFENYPQIPEEEFLGQTGEYELSLVVYDFQGIQREAVEDPDKVRLFLLIFSLRDNKVYQGPLTLEILDRDRVVHSERHNAADLENIYSLHRDLPNTGRYSLRATLHGENGITCVIPFRLSSQRVHWGKWIGLSLLALIIVAAIGGRKARIAMDRKEAHQREQKKSRSIHA